MFLIKDSKSPYYQLVYFRNGKRTKISTRTSNRIEAEKFKSTFKPHRKPLPQPRKISVKLSDFENEHKSYIRNTYSENYLKKAVTTSFNRLKYYVSDVPIDSISTKQLDQFISSVYAKSKYAALLYYKTLKAAFNKALIWEYLEENPFCKIKSPKVPKSFPNYITEAELIMILNSTATQLCKDIFTMAFYTGMRLGELLNMKWDWVDFSSQVITVKNSKSYNTKNKSERIIPANKKVVQILERQAESGEQLKNDYVFNCYAGIKFNEDFISRQFKKAVRAAGVDEKIHFILYVIHLLLL